MDPERYRRIKEVFQAALDVPADRREAYLAEVCGGDAELVREVGELLRRDASSGGEKTLPDDSQPAPAGVDDVPAGTVVGRFVVLEKVGAGGMGEVFAAYDPELDRKVALKLLHSRFRVEGSSSAEESRLLREAQALARLSHPNVVTVYEVGTWENRVFIAMEFVQGEDLKTWLAAGPRSWREVLAVFGRAGRGLAAAHRAGLVHRDFKPANVILGDDGRVRVLDFGLARSRLPDAAREPARGPDAAATQPGAALDTPLTEAGALVGTPGYMAPEQFKGEPPDAAADQYGFCVALYEALFGERPFANRSLAEMIAAGRGDVPGLPAGSRVPGWVRNILRRGLEEHPERRYPSMDALLAALEKDPRIRLRRWGAAAAAALLFLAAGWGIYRSRQNERLVCSGAEERWAGVWDADRKAAIKQAFLQTGSSQSESAWTHTTALVDRFERDWVDMRIDACEATHRRGEQSPELLDLRMACLDSRFERAQALIDIFASPDAAVVEKASRAMLELPGLDTCADTQLLTAPMALPSDDRGRAEVREIRSLLARADALRVAGKPSEALKLAEQAKDRAEKVAYDPVLAEAEALIGQAQTDLGEFQAAAESHFEGLTAAQRGRHEEMVARSLAYLVWAEGYDLADAKSAERWARLAEATFGRLDGAALIEALFLNNHGSVLWLQRRDEEALERFRRSLALRERALGPDHYQVAMVLNNIANVYTRQGRHEEALAESLRANKLLVGALGPEHPMVALSFSNIGAIQQALGRLDEAHGSLDRAWTTQRKVLGEEHPMTASSLFNLGAVEVEMGRYAEGQARLREAQRVFTAAFGGESPYLVYPLHGLGRAALELGDHQQAIELLQEVLTRMEAAEGFGFLPRDFVENRFLLGRALVEGGVDRSRGLALVQRARKDLEGLPEDHLEPEIDAWLARSREPG